MTTPADLLAADEALAKAVAAIAELLPDAEVILFGSRAAGTATADSDYDLMVITDTEDRYQTALRLTPVLRSIFSLPGFDLIVVPRADWERVRKLGGFVQHEADRHGVRLHARYA